MLKKWFRHMRNAAVADYQQTILSLLEPSRDRIALLDCGCDDGAWTVELAQWTGPAELSGVEIVPERRAQALARGVRAVEADLNAALPFEDGRFDVVHANQVIEHLADTDQFIREIYRVLKPGGYAIVCTENLASWHNIGALVFGWQPFSLANVCERRFQIGNPLAIHDGEAAANPKSWLHTRVFAYRGLIEVFAQHGFEIVRCVGSGYYPLPGVFARIDPRHAAFLTLKVRRPRNS